MLAGTRQKEHGDFHVSSSIPMIREMTPLVEIVCYPLVKGTILPSNEGNDSKSSGYLDQAGSSPGFFHGKCLNLKVDPHVLEFGQKT